MSASLFDTLAQDHFPHPRDFPPLPLGKSPHYPPPPPPPPHHTPPPPPHTPIAIIGAGPLGIELAVALKNARLAYTHFEAGQIGATMAWWAPNTRWFSSADRISIAGVPLVTPNQEKATREEYLA